MDTTGSLASTMDPFRRLPVEIVIMILSCCCDFTSLDTLLLLSPWALCVFNGSYRKITESVLKVCPLTAVKLHHLFRLAILIETNSFTCSVLHRLASTLLDTDDRTTPLPATMTAAVSRRLEAARPCTSTASLARLDAWLDQRGSYPMSRLAYQFQGQHVPSWIETFHTHRVLWNLELVHRNYQLAGSSWSWSEEDLKGFVLCYAELISIWERLHEFETISDCIRDMAASQIYPLGPDIPSFCTVPPPNEWKIQTCWSLPAIQTPQQEGRLLPWGQGLSATRVERSYLAFDWPVYDGWRLFSDDVLGIEDLRPYRQLGLPLFDRWRLYQLRLIDQIDQIESPDGYLVGGPDHDNQRELLVILSTCYTLASSE
ncbi:unnamed protein product [Penicillium salamii]|uniref:Uncharacterized protein n=1 Tax=Penicillium salamii TaxID=1612424 RepID=A0A9W4IFZ7_9EURO|nr:unnamed protein product [Penicillium salamii]